MQEDLIKSLKIGEWSTDDRPRERLLEKGKSELSDAELLSILIGTGTEDINALEVAKQLLLKVSNNVFNLSRCSPAELMEQRGVGKAKALTIVAGLELGRRARETDSIGLPKIKCSKDAFDIIYNDLADLRHEEFWVMLLNRANNLIRKRKISSGGVAGTVADPKLIYRYALESLACGIVVAHNHPSGNLVASKQDIELTNKLKLAGKLMEIELIDHLIVSGNKYYSFADAGRI